MGGELFHAMRRKVGMDHGEPPLDGHVRERVPELGATITTDLISSTVDREYPAQVVMLT